MSITDLFNQDDPSPLTGLSGEQTQPSSCGAPTLSSEPDREP